MDGVNAWRVVVDAVGAVEVVVVGLEGEEIGIMMRKHTTSSLFNNHIDLRLQWCIDHLQMHHLHYRSCLLQMIINLHRITSNSRSTTITVTTSIGRMRVLYRFCYWVLHREIKSVVHVSVNPCIYERRDGYLDMDI